MKSYALNAMVLNLMKISMILSMCSCTLGDISQFSYIQNVTNTVYRVL